MSHEPPPPSSPTFAGVLEQELRLVRLRREAILRQERERAKTQAVAADTHARIVGPPAAANLPVIGPGGVDPNGDVRLTHLRLEAQGEHLAGLAFSGGGIRSGTFAVGILQGLASLGLLRRFDYLSTVSGGGYAGAWLAAWLKRDGDVRNVERQLCPDRINQANSFRQVLNPPPPGTDPAAHSPEPGPVVDEEPEPLHHLRQFSSYLAPRFGLFTADTWTIIMIWIRNVGVNLLLFFPIAMALALAVRLLVYIYGALTPEAIAANEPLKYVAALPLLVGLILFMVAFGYNGQALREFRGEGPAARPRGERSRIYYRVIYPLLLASLLLSVSLRPATLWAGSWFEAYLDSVSTPDAPAPAPLSLGALREWLLGMFKGKLGVLDPPNVLAHALVLGILTPLAAFVFNGLAGGLRDPRTGRIHWDFLRAAVLSGITGGVLLTVAEAAFKALAEAGKPDLVALIGTPAIILVLAAGLIVVVALLGRSIDESEREWWSRFGAMMFIGMLLWLGVFATVLYVPALLVSVGLPLRMLLASGWLATTVAGVIASRHVGSPDNARPLPVALIASIAPPVFLVGMLGGVSLLAAFLVNDPTVVFPGAGREQAGIANYLLGVRQASAVPILLWLALFAILARVGSTLIDVNLFSLNAMYANRLTRCYLGASRPKAAWVGRWAHHDPRVISGAPTDANTLPRDENPVTGFDPGDDVDLLDLRIGSAPEGGKPYWGPHLLINTTLNLVGGQELAWRDRKGESFTLSPLYCGAKGTGYALVNDETRRRLTLGRAISVSGAAVDPNMKYYQSAPLTAFLTVLNARLGAWIENPYRRQSTQQPPKDWTAESPKYSKLLIKEFLGQTNGRGDYVHISDGGHFDNMGVYELVRRRCRYIVACDADSDTGPSDGTLATLIRLCRIDFGVRIELDTAPLRIAGDGKLSAAHVVTGRVRYDDVDTGQVPGILVYIKLSLTGDEPADVRQYAAANPDFPYQPTDLRQSFDEDQFESYRALGEHIARSVFQDAANKARAGGWFWGASTRPDHSTDAEDAHQEFARGNRRLFSALQGRWSERPPHLDERFARSARAWTELQRDFRDDVHLGGFTADLYPELPAPPAADVESRNADLHAVGQMLQIIEDAWTELGLTGHSDLPVNRGWMNVIRRWTGSEAFRRYWPLYRSEFNPDFVVFCESDLHLGPVVPRAVPLDDSPFVQAALKQLAAEYDREWPAEPEQGRGLQALIDRKLLGWLISQENAAPQAVGVPKEQFPCGIVLLLPDDDPDAYEFLAWVRRPNRSNGLGTYGVDRTLQDAIQRAEAEKPAGPLRLRARYPRSGRDGDDDPERSRWLDFFALYDFQPKSPRSPDAPPYSVSVRELRHAIVANGEAQS